MYLKYLVILYFIYQLIIIKGKEKKEINNLLLLLLFIIILREILFKYLPKEKKEKKLIEGLSLTDYWLQLRNWMTNPENDYDEMIAYGLFGAAVFGKGKDFFNYAFSGQSLGNIGERFKSDKRNISDYYTDNLRDQYDIQRFGRY